MEISFTKLLILTTSCFIITSCQSETVGGGTDSSISKAPSPSNCRTIVHNLGETEICDRPEKIVALGPYVLESLLALDIQPTGFADHIDWHRGPYNNPNQQIPYLGDRVSQPLINLGSAYTPSLEAIIEIQPDLIIGTKENIHQYILLSEIAPTVILEREESRESLVILGEVFNRSDLVKRSIAETSQLVSEARESFAPLVSMYPRVLLLSSFQLDEIRLADSSYGLCKSLLNDLNFELVFLPDSNIDNSGFANPISIESLPQLNDADSIIVLGYNFNSSNQIDGREEFEDHQLSSIEQAWESNEVAQSLDASMEGRVYFLPAYLCLGLPGPIGTSLYIQELTRQMLGNQNGD